MTSLFFQRHKNKTKVNRWDIGDEAHNGQGAFRVFFLGNGWAGYFLNVASNRALGADDVV